MISLARLSAVLTLLFLQCSQVQLQAVPVQCSLGEAGFMNLTLNELVRYSDVVTAGRVRKTERGEFGKFNADITYFFIWKSDAFVYKRLAYHTSVVGFSKPPAMRTLNMFFLMRQPSTLKLSLLCMSNSIDLLRVETIEAIKQIGRNETMKISELGVVYPDPCETSPSVCGPGGSCSALVSEVQGKSYRCTCLPGYLRNTTQQHCQPLTGEVSGLYCASCSYNARCSSQSNSDEVKCTCDHIQCEGTAERTLCGSDGITYQKKCDMKLASCKQQISIHRLYYGPCKSGLPPCMGLGEPLNTSTGFVNCQGVNDSCPMHHFCHSEDNLYAVCCPVLHPKVATIIPPSAAQTGSPISPPEPPVVPPSPVTVTPAVPYESGSGSGESGDDMDDTIDVDADSGSGNDSTY